MRDGRDAIIDTRSSTSFVVVVTPSTGELGSRSGITSRARGQKETCLPALDRAGVRSYDRSTASC
jgi:hypothetical protein